MVNVHSETPLTFEVILDVVCLGICKRVDHGPSPAHVLGRSPDLGVLEIKIEPVRFAPLDPVLEGVRD